MIDIHNHLIPDIDDGSDSIELSRQLLSDAKKEGISDVCITPHFIKHGPYNIRKNELMELFEQFKNDVKDIDINLYIGNELYIDRQLDELLIDDQVCAMNDSRYVLIEFPFDRYKDDYDEYLYNISLKYKIIIAHPERYRYVQKNSNFVDRWLENGYVLQANQTSLFYKETKKCLIDFIENGKLSIIASDCHNQMRPLSLINAYDFITRKFSKETAEILMNDNPLRVINDKNLKQVKAIKKRLF